jgi:phytoene dehydrogenase-like protein
LSTKPAGSARFAGRKACVVGSGPNGLAAAIVLAQAGLQVEVFEAEVQPGGGARTMELTLPGFRHDFGSAVHPMAVGSPFFSSLPLQQYGLRWIQPDAPVAHPMDDGTAVVLQRSLDDAERELGDDGRAWRRLMEPFAEKWNEVALQVLRPFPPFPRTPWLLARLGAISLSSANALANRLFKRDRAKALFAGMAAHSFLDFDEPLSAAFGVLLGVTAHAVGWPIPGGGAQCITNALIDFLQTLGGSLKTSARVENANDLPDCDLTMWDVSPAQLVHAAAQRLSLDFKKQLNAYRYGPGAFKVDYALSSPIPWKAADCLRAGTIHLGGTLPEIAASEYAARHGRVAERPFVLLSQPTLFDPSRAPQGKYIAWAYCHVPNGSTFDMLERLESQIERFAPGFRDCVLARRVFTPAALQTMNANLIGGDIAGGASTLKQFLFRPTWRMYATSAPDIYLCSASTPPGAGVHGMCGYNAAKLALSRLR